MLEDSIVVRKFSSCIVNEKLEAPNLLFVAALYYVTKNVA